VAAVDDGLIAERRLAAYRAIVEEKLRGASPG
jgi:hypothetical protein